MKQTLQDLLDLRNDSLCLAAVYDEIASHLERVREQVPVDAHDGVVPVEYVDIVVEKVAQLRDEHVIAAAQLEKMEVSNVPVLTGG